MKTKLFAITIAIFAVLALKVQAQESSPATATAASPSTTTTAAQKADTELDGVTVELVSTTRTDGDTVTIKFKFNNSGQKDAELNLTGYSPDNLAAKVYCIDSKNKKKYLVVTDATGTPICSNLKGNTKLKPGESKNGWTKLSAPPTDVTTISVYLPGTPPFEGVTIAAK